MPEAKSKPRVSSRGQTVPASPIRKLVPFADAAKARGVQVLHLNIGQPDLETPLPMRERLLALRETTYAYSPSAGTAECLEVLRGYYGRLGISLRPSEIIATTGGSEAILFALMALAGVGDEALVVEPFYTNYASFAVLAGVRLKALPTQGEDGFHLPPLEVWERALSPKTRLVLLCNPNNPTGTVYSPEEIRSVAEFCARHGLFLVLDEVYREFVYDGRECRSALTLPGLEDHVVVVDSLSKRYSACGIRLGCLATRNPEVYDACLRMAQGRLSPPGLAQFVAVGAAGLGREYTEGVVREYQSRRDLLYEGLLSIPGVFLRKPEGAFYCVARLPVEDAEDFARWLLTDFQHEGATVMVAPAAGFYASAGMGRDEVRVAYVLGAKALRVALAALSRALDAYPGARRAATDPAAARLPIGG
jgi:aspartate aminotransferase